MKPQGWVRKNAYYNQPGLYFERYTAPQGGWALIITHAATNLLIFAIFGPFQPQYPAFYAL